MNLNEQKEQQVLTSYGVSSLVINTLGGQAGGQSATVTGFYFDFAAKKSLHPPARWAAAETVSFRTGGSSGGDIERALRPKKCY